MLPRTNIHLLSGGLDSVTLLYDLHQQGIINHCLLVNYQQQHVQELQFAKLHCRRLNRMFTVIDIPMLGGLNEESWIVPCRNQILLSLACNLAVRSNTPTVTIAVNRDDEAAFPDCRMAFIQLFNTMLTTAEINVEVCAPYINRRKWEIADLSKQLGVPPHETWTCYKGGANPCGICPACLKFNDAIKSRE